MGFVLCFCVNSSLLRVKSDSTFVLKLPFLHVASGDSGVWGLKKNFALLELLERLQNGASNQSGMADDTLKGMGEVSRP